MMPVSRCIRCGFIIPLIMMVSACSTARIVEGQGKTSWHFGFVKIVEPDAEGVPEAYRLELAGLTIGREFRLGWSAREEVLLPLPPPAEPGAAAEAPCYLVVIIRSTAEARHARSILEGLEGVDPCIISFDGDLPLVMQWLRQP